jgi:putative ABC transport system substrate-binding protein
VVRGAGVALLVVTVPAHAQRPAALPHVAFLTPGQNPREDAFWAGMRELGYVSGRNMVVDRRSAEGDFARLPGLAADIVKGRPDVLVAIASAAAVAAKQATATIPIVMVGSADPVGAGLATSLARPGGNVTGTATQTTVAWGKLLELTREIRTGTRRIAALWHPGNAISAQLRLGETLIAAARLNIFVRLIEVRTVDDLERAFVTLGADPPDAVLVSADTFFLPHATLMAERALATRLPLLSTGRQVPESGGFASFGPDQRLVARRAATYVHRILRGAKPGELPIEQPTKFELVINLRTAEALGMTLPASVIARADEVIR